MRAVRILAVAVACGAGAGTWSPHSTFLADLTLESEEALRAMAAESAHPAEAKDLLGRILAGCPSYRFDAGLFHVETDQRWFATTPADREGSAVLELRRWPGDTVLSLFVLAGEAPPEGAASVRLEGQEVRVRSDAMPGTWRWDGRIDSEAGPRPAVWVERRSGEIPGRIGALILPGDAGLGDPAISDLILEALVVAANVEVREDAWRFASPVPAGAAVALPEVGAAPGSGDEKRNPWQVISGPGCTLGVPPGVRARRLDRGIAAPRPVSGASIWFRGRYHDREGSAVEIGDGVRAGYVAEVPSPQEAWIEGTSPPLGAPGAVRVAAAPYTEAANHTGARSARAERWSEPGFQGNWLVFRLVFEGSGIEIGIPVLAGWQSQSLFWIPLTWRGAGSPPAPPPIDPADRFGIRFEQLGKLSQKDRPWTAGFLTAPGFRAEMPRGWMPSATLRSEKGYPIRILSGSGETVARIVRLEKGEPILADAEASGFSHRGRPASHRASASYSKVDGTALFVAPEGHGFLFEPEPGARLDPEVWDRMIRSVSLAPTGEAPDGAGE